MRREYPTAIGPVDIMAIDADGTHVAIEIKRHGGIDGVEQLTRYCELLNRDPCSPLFAASSPHRRSPRRRRCLPRTAVSTACCSITTT